MKITKTGTYDLAMTEYHGQPADALSMSASDAVILTEETPAHLRAAWAEAKDATIEADLGTIIHSLILEPHHTDKVLVVVDADNYKTKAAQDARDEARAKGKIPILPKQLKEAQGAVAAVLAHPVASHLLSKGSAERSWFAKDKATGLYRKARPDFFTSDRIIVDVKSVTSAAPAFIQRRVYDGAWFQQCPWYCDVVERVDGQPAKGYCWLIVEQKPPHCVVVRRPTDTILMHGHRLNERAFSIFARCAAENQWPGYSDGIEDMTLPSYAMFRLEEDGLAEESNPRKGFEALAFAEKTGAHPFS